MREGTNRVQGRFNNFLDLNEDGSVYVSSEGSSITINDGNPTPINIIEPPTEKVSIVIPNPNLTTGSFEKVEDIIPPTGSRPTPVVEEVINTTIDLSTQFLPEVEENFQFAELFNNDGINIIEYDLDNIEQLTAESSTYKLGRGAQGKNGRLSDSELKSLSEIGFSGQKLSIAAANDFIKMYKAMPEDIKKQVLLTDAYRSFEVQNIKFDWDEYVRTGGSLEDTSPKKGATRRKRKTSSTSIAFPGTSNHGLGIAIDIFNKNGKDTVQMWIKKNGVKYGWSWTEGKSIKEDWHFTYNPSDKRVYV